MIGAGAPCTCPACLPCTCHPHLPGDSVLQTCRWATHCMGAPSQVKPEGAAGPTRISLISPPQDGHVGSISYRGPQNLSLTPNQSMAKPLRGRAEAPSAAHLRLCVWCTCLRTPPPPPASQASRALGHQDA
ncbi:probable E3 SUMO-protein ligase RNF212 isoform X7 [Nycticebus coucang]|uniref:probable E3 SUMO-protein ligase RNF212 isoform X7 n=1 Tax=Nycticebus coucang TaxID=9470 RepID=UPI00234E18F1|nr:probable E3 SUMO-protein ligase RNF212 isoform X7 [Nycticebus coucang]